VLATQVVLVRVQSAAPSLVYMLNQHVTGTR
jgi:hypothetical protein